MDKTIVGVIVGAVVSLTSTVMAFLGGWVSYRRDQRGKDRQAIRAAHAEFLARQNGMLHEMQLFVGLSQAQRDLWTDIKKALADAQERADERAVVRMSQVSKGSASPELDDRIRRHFDIVTEAMRQADAAWFGVLLLDPDDERRAQVRSVYEPPLELPLDEDDLDGYQDRLAKRRREFERVSVLLSQSLIAKR